ncbi:MAG: Spy/CpxP family protein refolding chaperone [Bacteroidales bacterium]|nr:Spy/CpxP family protein refolding chaperone [Bacteroidales bacterium]
MLKKTLFLGLALVGAIWVSNVSAQCNHGNMNHKNGQHSMHAIPDLTEKQAEDIDALRVPHQKVMMDLHNQMAEKQAKITTLTTGDNVDVAAAKIVMKEISALKLQMAEARLDHRMAIRKMLNDEQRLWFDMHHSGDDHHMGHGSHGPGMGKGMHSGHGNASGSGMHDGSGPHGTNHQNANPDCPHKTE